MMTITPAATDYLQKMIAKNESTKGLRISIKKTGCSGYSYFPSLIDDINPADIKVEMAPQVTIYVDSEWLNLLDGLHIDYIEEEKTGLKQKRLVFTNPKEASRCGCGESFHIE